MRETECFFREMRRCGAHEVLQRQVAYWACPVLGNIKPAVLFHVRGEGLTHLWLEIAGPMLQSAGLEEARLSDTPSQMAVLLYRAPALAAWLARPDNRELLRQFGYRPDAPPQELLARLRRRYDADAFPHEIGVFLGYPACDVEGFIRHGGRNYKLCGHWKVYGDVEQSRQTFTRIDRTRERVAGMINNRVPAPRALAMV